MKYINTKNAPRAIGPYSQAVIVGNLLFCSGQIPIDKNGNIIEGSIKIQASQIFKNISNIVSEAGFSISDIVKVTVYMTDLSSFSELNEIYSEFFIIKPARTTVQVSKLPKDAQLEIDVIAYKV